MKKVIPASILSHSTWGEEVARKFILNSDVERSNIRQKELQSGEVASFRTYELYLEYALQEHIFVPRPM